MKIPKSVSLERQQKAWELHQQCFTHAEIAKQMGIEKVGTVTKILHRLNKKFLKTLYERIESVKMEQIAKLENVVRESYFAWVRSKEASRISKKKYLIVVDQNTGKESQHPVERFDEARNQDGDPRYLKNMMEAMAEIRKILGANAAIKIDNNNRNYFEGDSAFENAVSDVIKKFDTLLPIPGGETQKAEEPEAGNGADFIE